MERPAARPRLMNSRTGSVGVRRRTRRGRLWKGLAVALAACAATGIAIMTVPPWHEQVMTAVLLSSGQINAPSNPPVVTLCTSLRSRWGARTAHRPHGIAVAPGRVETGTLVSEALRGARRPYYIYLPPGYDLPAFRHRRYPVVYLLHGAPGRAHDWVWGGQINAVANHLISDCRIVPMIIMMPDGNGGLQRDTQYVNRWDGKENDATYIVRDVVSFVDHHFRTLPDSRFRAIMGNSEGGYAAVNLTAQYPNVFRVAVALSGYFRADPHELATSNNPFGHDQHVLRANSPILRIPALPSKVRRSLHIFLYDGANDTDNAPATHAFARQLTRSQVPHYWDNQNAEPIGALYHTWVYWRDSARDALGRISALFVAAHHGLTPGASY